jgi:hypothetical protein
MPLSSIAMGATIAPKIEVLTMLACDHLKPEYTAGHGLEDLGFRLPGWARHSTAAPVALSSPVQASNDQAENNGAFWTVDGKSGNDYVFLNAETGGNGTTPTNPQKCKSDPVVQKAVAKLSAG